MIFIVQPTTTEQNLGGICYTPYWMYAHLKRKNLDVKIFENVTMRDLEPIVSMLKEDDEILIDLSSYGQTVFALEIYRELRKHNTCKFIGYKPQIMANNLPFFQHGADYEKDVFEAFFHSNRFKYSLLSDCDSHIKTSDPRKVVPIFLSVGCDKKCPFCYASTDAYPFGVADKATIKKIIDKCADDELNIHFCDEDFFEHPEIEYILELLGQKNIKYICLTTARSLLAAVKKFGIKRIRKSGNFLNEIGLETMDTAVLSKNQNLMKDVIATGLNVFWLTMTFMPNETINSLRLTGDFLSKHGKDIKDLLPRIATNSTAGGLGQFFQPYHGTKWYNNLSDKGVVYTENSTRLYPSFIGHTFLREVPNVVRGLKADDFKWFELYFADTSIVEKLYTEIDGINNNKYYIDKGLDRAIVLAQFARLGIIE